MKAIRALTLVFTLHALSAAANLSLPNFRRDGTCPGIYSGACTGSNITWSGPTGCEAAVCTQECITALPILAGCCQTTDIRQFQACLNNGGTSVDSSSSASSVTSSIASSISIPSSLLPYAAACTSFNSIFTSCIAATPGFTTLSFVTGEAECLCFPSSTWNPGYFDGYFTSCLYYVSVESPAVYTSYTATVSGFDLSGPCAGAATALNVAASTSVPVTTPSTTTLLVTTTASSSMMLTSPMVFSTPAASLVLTSPSLVLSSPEVVSSTSMISSMSTDGPTGLALTNSPQSVVTVLQTTTVLPSTTSGTEHSYGVTKELTGLCALITALMFVICA